MRVYVIETQSRDRYNRAPEKATWFSLTLFFGFVFHRVFQSVPLQWSISFSFSDGGGGEFSPMRKQNNKKKNCAAVLFKSCGFIRSTCAESNNCARSFVFKHLIIFRGGHSWGLFLVFTIQVVLDGRIKRAFRSALVATSASTSSENSSSIRQPKSQQPQQRCAQVREVVVSVDFPIPAARWKLNWSRGRDF